MSVPYRVLWRRRVSEETLANLLVQVISEGTGTAAITAAVDEIDRVLATDPQTRGESRGEWERVLVVEPLTVFFEVQEDERIVYVLSLHYRP